MGTLDIKEADMKKAEASNYMRIIAARLNAKPYGIRFVGKSDIGPLHPAQDLPMEVISPNHWKIIDPKVKMQPLYIFQARSKTTRQK